MSIVCSGCQGWVEVEVDKEAQRVRCRACGHAEPMRILPLFIVTGTSASGKTAVIPALRRLLPEWDIFETDILWDSGGDWQMQRCNWLRIAHSIAQSGRGTILCGTQVPENMDRCDFRPFFSAIHYLALHCDDITREARLRARPAWRGCTDAFIAEQQQFAHWLLENADTAFDPPLQLVDTTEITVEQAAEQIRDWVRQRWPL